MIRSSSLTSTTVFLYLPLLLLLLPTTEALTDNGYYCDTEKNAYANCVFRMEPASAGKACDDCRIATFDDLSSGDNATIECDQVEMSLCSAVNSCGCAECQDELEDFWRCTTETTEEFFDHDNNDTYTCSIDCGITQHSPTETGPLCPTEFDNYKNCVLDDLDAETREDCDSCRLAASASIPANVSDCRVVQDIFCRAVQTCNCQSCASPLEAYLDCDVNKRWFGLCNVDCSNSQFPPGSDPTTSNNKNNNNNNNSQNSLTGADGVDGASSTVSELNGSGTTTTSRRFLVWDGLWRILLMTLLVTITPFMEFRYQH